jgi:anti-sigma factor ChrR (cupin superfamily)
MNFAERIVIETAAQDWQSSPAAGVWRKPLAREYREQGHATSIVRYEPGSRFNTHPHPKGEEILVLEGVFSDETGDYPAGTYLRNPPGSRHAPFSEQGCVIFVKLDQFDESDQATVRVNTQQTDWLPGQGGLQVIPLHDHNGEHTALVKWPAGEQFLPHRHWGGEEILVLSGEFQDEHGVYPPLSWIRSPHLSEHHPFVTEKTVILVKTGHLV